MLWAQFAPKNPVQQNAFWAGVIIGAIIWGAIPLVCGLIFGLKLRSNPRAQGRALVLIILGVVGALMSAGTGFLLGCLGGLPMALIFVVVIIVVGMTAPEPRRRRRDPDEDDYDDRDRRRRPRYDDDDDEDDRPRRRRRDFDDY